MVRDDDAAALTAAAGLLLSGRSWPIGGDGVSLTYSFLTSAPDNGGQYGASGFQVATEEVKAGVRQAFAAWSAVARITFTEASAGAEGDLQVGMADLGGWSGWAYFPGPGRGGDIFFAPNRSLDPHLFIHEIGHALGLKHPHEAPLLTGVMDSSDYTVMSYNSTGRSLTPMVLDILAVQQLYGANPSYRGGDDTYVFGAGGLGISIDDNIAIYDTGGRNGFDFSGFADPLIDLREGHFSAISQYLYFGDLSYQVAVAPGTVIKAATGGSGGSLFYGNDAGNVLTGGAGDDVFHPGAGADRVDGGAGVDRVAYADARAAATLGRFGDEVLVRRGGVTDRLAGIEVIGFADGDVAADTVAAPAEAVVEAAGQTRVLEAGGWYRLADAAGTGPLLSYQEGVVSAGQFGDAVPIGAEAVAGGYRVAWKAAGADQYVAWTVGEDGDYLATALAAVAGASPALQALEAEFGQDLNGDGSVGPKTTVIEAVGATRLVQEGARFLLRDGGGAGPALRDNGAEVVAGQFGAAAPIGAEAVADGYRVAWKVAGADQYVVWATDAAGNHVGNVTAVVAGNDPALVAQEPVLGQDLNGDGRVGAEAVLPVVSLAAAASVSEASVRMVVSATLDRAAVAPASVRWRLVPGSASPGDGDMPADQGGVLAFGDGTTGRFEVRLHDEAHKLEGDEAFAIELYDAVGLTIGQGAMAVALADSYVAPPAVPASMVHGPSGAASMPVLDPYQGPVAYLDRMLVLPGDDGVVLSVEAPNVFLKTGGGDDAVRVAAGQNVIDAGRGSNFVTGGAGADTFYLDARGGGTLWSTVVGFGAGDDVTLWGLTAADFALAWLDGVGAPGYEGLTLRATGPADVTLTLAGRTLADLEGGRLGVAFGHDAASGSDYLYVAAL